MITISFSTLGVKDSVAIYHNPQYPPSNLKRKVEPRVSLYAAVSNVWVSIIFQMQLCTLFTFF